MNPISSINGQQNISFGANNSSMSATQASKMTGPIDMEPVSKTLRVQTSQKREKENILS